MRPAEDWEHVIHAAAHLGAPGELIRQIKRVQDDARQDIPALLREVARLRALLKA